MIDVLLTLFVLAAVWWAGSGLFANRMGDGENRSATGETDQTKFERERQK